MEEKTIRPKRVAVHYIPPPARKHQDAKIHEAHRTKGRPMAVNENKVEKLCNDSSLLFRDSHSERKVKFEKTNRSVKTRTRPCSRGKGHNLDKSSNLTLSNKCVPPLNEARINLSEIANLPPLETRFESCLLEEGNGSDLFPPYVSTKQSKAFSKTIVELKSPLPVGDDNEIINNINESENNTVSELQEQNCDELGIKSIEFKDSELNNPIELGEPINFEKSIEFKMVENSDIIAFEEPVQLERSIDISEPVDLAKPNEIADSVELFKLIKIDDPPEIDSLSELDKLLNSPVEDDSIIRMKELTETAGKIDTHHLIAIDVSAVDKIDTSEVLFCPEPSDDCSHNLTLQPDFNIDDSDWDLLYNEHGECIISSTASEPKKEVNELLKPSALTNDDFSKDLPDDNSSIIEIYGFSEDLRTSDLHTVFCNYVSRGFILKWVDNTHALGILPTPSLAQEVLVSNLPLVKTRPISQGTSLSQDKAKTLILPSAMRPKTCSALARRLVSGALGLRVNISPEERAAEKKLLKEAREKKKMILMQKEAAWEGNVSLLGE